MRIHQNDNVEVREDGHKVALFDIKKGENIIKYGSAIGHASCDIKKGEHVHSHNLKTNLSGNLKYTYNYKDYGIVRADSDLTFEGYVRENGDVGIRNEIWIVNTVGCVNKVAQALSEKTGAKCFTHPYGCSQLGGDHEITQKILCSMIRHPNAGGVLVLGLGCENNNIGELKRVLGEYDEKRVKFLNCQDVEDEIEAGAALIDELKEYTNTFKREKISISRLKIGLKCGGSDAYSGITANPVVGNLCDRLVSFGSSLVLTEVPEMFGAEHLLMERCQSKEVFEKTVSLINNFKDYFKRHGQQIYENPSPGNKAGGISTLEEKSLGCVQKGGTTRVNDVLKYAQRVKETGLTLLESPGNDPVAATALASAGCQIVLFSTGRGTPFSTAVPTVKISSNTTLFEKKQNWIDFNAGSILTGTSLDNLSQDFFDYILSVANGKKTKAEENGYKEISIFKTGVTL